MIGYIRKRGKHSFQIIISAGWDETKGRYIQHTYTVHGSKTDAQNRLLELQHQRLTGTYLEPSKTTLGQFLDRWYREYVVPNCKPRTADSYESIINFHLKPALGRLELTKIKPDHLLGYQTEKLNGDKTNGTPSLSTTSVRHHHMVLHGALKSAVSWGLLSHNPADAVMAPRPRKTQMQTWDVAEIHSFLEATSPTPYYNEFYTELHTGLRLSELLAPRWRDLDLERGFLEITRGLYQRKGRLEFGSLKNTSAYRTIELTPTNIAVLREQRQNRNSTA